MLDGLKALKPVAWAVGNWHILAAVLAAFTLTNSVSYCKGRDDGRASEQADAIAAERAAQLVEDKSKGQAASERKADDLTINTAQEGRDNAIMDSTQDDARPSDSRIALNCQRMRAAGADIQHIPACRGREGRSKADARP